MFPGLRGIFFSRQRADTEVFIAISHPVIFRLCICFKCFLITLCCLNFSSIVTVLSILTGLYVACAVIDNVRLFGMFNGVIFSFKSFHLSVFAVDDEIFLCLICCFNVFTHISSTYIFVFGISHRIFVARVKIYDIFLHQVTILL